MFVFLNLTKERNRNTDKYKSDIEERIEGRQDMKGFGQIEMRCIMRWTSGGSAFREISKAIS